MITSINSRMEQGMYTCIDSGAVYCSVSSAVAWGEQITLRPAAAGSAGPIFRVKGDLTGKFRVVFEGDLLGGICITVSETLCCPQVLPLVRPVFTGKVRRSVVRRSAAKVAMLKMLRL